MEADDTPLHAEHDAGGGHTGVEQKYETLQTKAAAKGFVDEPGLAPLKWQYVIPKDVWLEQQRRRVLAATAVSSSSHGPVSGSDGADGPSTAAEGAEAAAELDNASLEDVSEAVEAEKAAGMDAGAAAGSAAADNTGGGQEDVVGKKRARGQNKKRTHEQLGFKAGRSDAQLCRFVLAGEPQKCRYGARCRDSHDMQGFLATKPADLGPTCAVYTMRGVCPAGINCRWGRAHMDEATGAQISLPEDQRPVVAESINILPSSLGADLRRGKHNYRHVMCKAYGPGWGVPQGHGGSNGNGSGYGAKAAGPESSWRPAQEWKPGMKSGSNVKGSSGGANAAQQGKGKDGKEQKGKGKRQDKGKGGQSAASSAAQPDVGASDGFDGKDGSAAPTAKRQRLADGTAADAGAAGAGAAASDADAVSAAGAPAGSAPTTASATTAQQEATAGAAQAPHVHRPQEDSASALEQADAAAAAADRQAVAATGHGSSASSSSLSSSSSAPQQARPTGGALVLPGHRQQPGEKPTLDLHRKIYVAPLTTVGNLPFRRILMEMGAQVTCGEMALAENLVAGSASEWALLRRHPSEKCFGVQLAGHRPDVMARAGELMSDTGCSIDFVDINSGCPLDEICNRGCGAALMGKHSRARDCVLALDATLPCPVTYKMRTGLDKDVNSRFAHKLIGKMRLWSVSNEYRYQSRWEGRLAAFDALRAASGGGASDGTADDGASAAGSSKGSRDSSFFLPHPLAAVTVHGRTRQQRYSSYADWSYISSCVKAGRDPIVRITRSSLKEAGYALADPWVRSSWGLAPTSVRPSGGAAGGAGAGVVQSWPSSSAAQAQTSLPSSFDPYVELSTGPGLPADSFVDLCPPPLPVLGNGDVMSWQEWEQRLDATGVETVLLGRGPLIKPWLCTEIAERRTWDISSSERLDILKRFTSYGLDHWGSDQAGVNRTRRFLLEWLSFLCRYIPVGLMERLPQRMNDRPLPFYGRDDLESLMASTQAEDWVKITEMLLGPVPDDFLFVPKHKSNSYSSDVRASTVSAVAGSGYGSGVAGAGAGGGSAAAALLAAGSAPSMA